MASDNSDRDAKDALSKLLQMGMVAEYQNEFEILINRVTGISQSLLTSFYISRLKLELQRELWRSRPTTLGEAFSLAHIAEARTQTHQQHELLVSRPIMLGDAFSLAHNIEARFEEIAEKEQNIKEKANTTLSLSSEEALPVVKGPLDDSEDTLLSLRSEDLNFKIQEKVVEYVRALNAAPLELVFAEPVDELPEGGNSHSAYSPYHLEGKVIFKGVRNVTPWAADGGRRKKVKRYVQGSGRGKMLLVA
ncbi:hypothetical protein Tco_1159764, partial [Tanacetum coccineum]